jgi:very-short-patch-repair endonuclease
MNIDIDYIQNKYNIKILKQNDELLFCCSDIGKMLELKNIRSSICKLQKKQIDTITISGNQKMSYFNYENLCKMVVRSRKPNVLEIANDFGIDILKINFISVETEILNNIIKTFKNERYKLQYNINNKYFIDLYFPDYNLALECDEKQHNIEKNKLLDKEREDYIKNELNCVFIRFKPYDNNFDIFKLINKIYLHIKNFN